MKRLTTNCPNNNLDAALNLFYIKDFETWVRGGGDGPDYPDIRLYDFIRKAAKILLPDLDFPMDDDGVDYAMGELLLDGPDEPTGLLALLYTAAWSYAELRGRLMQYEDTGLSPKGLEHAAEIENGLNSDGYSIARMVELMNADKDGRVLIPPCKIGDKLYRVFAGEIFEHRVGSMKYFAIQGRWDIETYPFCPCVESSIGKTIFLTREEAEKALEAMKDE